MVPLFLSRHLGFILYFVCSKLVCCEITQSCHLSACTVSISTQSTATHGPMVFPHTLPSVTTHTFCVLSHTDTCCSNCCPLSDPCRQRSCPLNHCSLGDSHTLAFSCGSRALALQQSTGLLSCLVGKNIHRLILFEWVMLFKKQTVNVLIGNYIHRVNVIKGSLYSQVYSMSC